MSCPGLDQRAAKLLTKSVSNSLPTSLLGNLTGAAGDDALMTFAAALRVESRADAVLDAFRFLEDKAIAVERTAGDYGVLGDFFDGGPCSRKPFVLLSKPLGASVAAVFADCV